MVIACKRPWELQAKQGGRKLWSIWRIGMAPSPEPAFGMEPKVFRRAEGWIGPPSGGAHRLDQHPTAGSPPVDYGYGVQEGHEGSDVRKELIAGRR